MTKQNIFYNRLIEQVQLKHKTVDEVERELGYCRNALNNYKCGRAPSTFRLIELSEYFKVTPEYLVGKESTIVSKSYAQHTFERLSEKEKLDMLSFCQNWASTCLANIF